MLIEISSFGFNDGISQPAIDGVDKAPKGQDTIDQGVILCNRGSNAGQHPDWMTDGSFMCFRKLEQNVPAWNKFLVDTSNTLGTWSGQLGARLIGRWPSGKFANSPESLPRGGTSDEFIQDVPSNSRPNSTTRTSPPTLLAQTTSTSTPRVQQT
jgi:deferrochelatase/peroxidase EfeB